jgi:hypothetical protein
MNIRHHGLPAFAALALAAGLAAPALAQDRAGITGFWGRYFPAAGQPFDPKLAPPPAGDPPLKPEPLKAFQAQRAVEKAADEKGEPIAGNSVACLPDGMPQMMFAIYPMQIAQGPDEVTVIQEAYSQVRHIHLNKPQVDPADYAPGYFGHSVGRWEGDTLVVDTVGLKDNIPMARSVPHSDQMRITERIRLVAPDVLQDQITITDPKVLERPWTFAYAYRRLPGYEMLEYVCEDNREYVDEKGGTHLRLGGS